MSLFNIVPLLFGALCPSLHSHGVLSLCTALWSYIIVMQKKHVSVQPDSVDALLECS